MEEKIEAVITSDIRRLDCVLEKGGSVRLEEQTVIPSRETQTIVPSSSHDGLSKVTVAPIPQCYGLITYDGAQIMVS